MTLAELSVDRPDISDRLARGLVGREVAAARVHVPADDLLLIALGEAPDAAEVAVEAGQADRAVVDEFWTIEPWNRGAGG
jgi:hypothetical protein